MADVFTMLEADHRRVERMLERLADSEEGGEREQLVAQLTAALELHMRFEEEAIYPVLRQLDGEMAEEAEVEHRLAREGIGKLTELVARPGFGAAVDMVTAGISHHVEEEEGEAFPKLRQQTDEATLDQLGATLRRMKADAGMAEMELEDASKDELLAMAQEAGIEGRSSMTKDELREALSALPS